ncbi:MAG: NAD(+)/NADH kinase, partial [Cyclobacteriaceae bacterium]|nr:NAD(+)/NADH kinase [Cyclobacteriaceae bacterium]
MPQINYLFVVNPISGGNDKSAFYRFIEEENQRMGFSYELYKTTGTDDESRLIKLVIHHKPEVIVAVGGDGTLLLAAKVVKNSSIKIGLIPFGSANGMSRELNIPKIPDISLSLNPSQRFKECWNIIKNERVQEVDLLQINKNHYSLHLSDIGLNAKIVKRFEAEKIRGYFGYARLFFKELKQKKRIS